MTTATITAKTPAAGTITRRTPLHRAGTTAAVATTAAVIGRASSGINAAEATPSALTAASGPVPFHGPHQAGIATTPPAHVTFVTWDVTTTSLADLRQLLRRWSDAADALTQGRPLPAQPATPADQQGDAAARDATTTASLTVTFGVGPSLFDGRFGLAGRRPQHLTPLPAFRGDALDPDISDGDLMTQICAEDPQIVFATVRALTRLARGTARVRWQQNGFSASATARAAATPRNLMGHTDGTINPQPGTEAFDRTIWVADSDEPAWLQDGSYLIARKIRINLDAWDQTPLRGQELTIGRRKDTGAPLSGGQETSAPDFTATTNGVPAIPADSHIRLANPAANGGATMLRRGYSYDDGVQAGTGDPDSGLLFLAYVADPSRQYIPVQRRLADNDRLNAYTRHTASALFAVLPGAQPGQYIGQALFA